MCPHLPFEITFLALNYYLAFTIYYSLSLISFKEQEVRTHALPFVMFTAFGQRVSGSVCTTDKLGVEMGRPVRGGNIATLTYTKIFQSPVAM